MKSTTVLVLNAVLLVCALGLSIPPPSCLAAENEPTAEDSSAAAQESLEEPKDEDSTDFTQFSLEELKDVVIVSVSKKPAMVSEVAAAVYVITQDDIRRSGVTSIPEALRLAPGVHVARITATDWAINIRGLNDQFAQNLLVMIDGRKVYTHVFSGVFWDVQDTRIEDIDRIEVIRGSGAALWGSNAVNGVINIITKHAKDTQGWQTAVLGGSEEQSGSLRYGGTLKNGVQYRTYGKFFNRGDLSDVGLSSLDRTSDPNDAQATDDWRSIRGGFRVDVEPGHGLVDTSPNAFTLQGEAYTNRYEKEFERRSFIFPGAVSEQSDRTETSRAVGWHLMGRWQHTINSDSETILRLYYDQAKKDYDPGSGKVHTTDLDFQHRLPMGKIQEVIWGLEYRFISDEFDESPNIELVPSKKVQNQWSAFIQDEVTLVPDLLTLIAGSKFEQNEFTGLEIQPNIRALYTPDRRYSIWAAVSRAVRVPSRLELHGRTSDQVELPNVDPDNPVEVTTTGNPDLDAEDLTAFELGVRLKPSLRLRFDTTLFFNLYRDLIGLELDDDNPTDDRIDLGYANNRSGQAFGFETVLDWKISDTWLLGGSYTYLLTSIDENKVNDPDIEKLIVQDSNPRHLFSVRSSMDITPQIDFDLWLRYVSRLPERNIDGYTVMDARISYLLQKNIELSLVGQNLLESGHSEFSSLEVERSVYIKIVWDF